tara:strand:+ start:2157 stop:2840 length:684 start_codon:yes stop_codon:yes gene_type:complete
MAKHRYKYKVYGPKGGVYLTTTKAEAIKLTRNGGFYYTFLNVGGEAIKLQKTSNPRHRDGNFYHPASDDSDDDAVIDVLLKGGWVVGSYGRVQAWKAAIERAGFRPMDQGGGVKIKGRRKSNKANPAHAKRLAAAIKVKNPSGSYVYRNKDDSVRAHIFKRRDMDVSGVWDVDVFFRRPGAGDDWVITASSEIGDYFFQKREAKQWAEAEYGPLWSVNVVDDICEGW